MPGWWDDDFEDEDPRSYSQPLSTIYGASWDGRKQAWVCICPEYRRRDICRHTISFRRAEVVEPKEEYL